MKRLFTFLIAFSMCLLAACSGVEDTSDYVAGKLDFAAQTEFYKTYGRTYVNENGLNVDFPGNGFEFEVQCSGDVTMHCRADANTYFQVFVDGEEGLRVKTGRGKNLDITIATGLDAGTHNIRVIRDTDIDLNGNITGITGIGYVGKADTLKRPADKDLLIEFVGDSITAGKRTVFLFDDNEVMDKATNSFAYLTAEALDADFSVIARGGCGFFRFDACPKTINQIYQYYNIFSRENTEKYTPTRKADVVVLAIGANDSADRVKFAYEKGIVPFATFEEALKDQIGLIRQMHGEDVKIVLLYNMNNSSWEEEFQKVAQEEDTYILKATKNQDGINKHPSTEGHKVIADELTAYLQETVLK